MAKVRDAARDLDCMVLWRDLREGVGAMLLAIIFGWIAWQKTMAGRPSWTCWIATALPLGVAVFLLVDRLRARRSRPKADGSVIAELDRAIAELRHQAWLLTTVLWWYLLPLGLSVGMIGLHAALYSPSPYWLRVTIALVMVLITCVVMVPLWRLNHRFAQNEVRPWIEELETRRRQLSGD